jgi:hypothetical protein
VSRFADHNKIWPKIEKVGSLIFLFFFIFCYPYPG